MMMFSVGPITSISLLSMSSSMEPLILTYSLTTLMTLLLESSQMDSKFSNIVLMPPGAEPLDWIPHTLPMCSQEQYDAMLEDIASQTTKHAHDNLHQYHGILHVSAICEFPSMKLFKSFPHEWMHLVLENHAKNLLHLWKGTYKGLDKGKEQYVIADGAWTQIGLETTASSAMIPSSFGQHMLNIWMEQYQFTAKDYAHWFLYCAICPERSTSLTNISFYSLISCFSIQSSV